MSQFYVRVRYWHQFIWFYVWKWTMPWLHARTIRGVNDARQGYLEAYRCYWPKGAR